MDHQIIAAIRKIAIFVSRNQICYHKIILYLCYALEGVAKIILQPSIGIEVYELDYPDCRRALRSRLHLLSRTCKDVAGIEWCGWIGGFIAFSVLSMTLLAKATQTIPLGTAYPVWTGIGAIGTVLIGIFVFNEPTTFWRLFFITTLIISVVGLKAIS